MKDLLHQALMALCRSFPREGVQYQEDEADHRAAILALREALREPSEPCKVDLPAYMVTKVTTTY